MSESNLTPERGSISAKMTAQHSEKAPPSKGKVLTFYDSEVQKPLGDAVRYSFEIKKKTEGLTQEKLAADVAMSKSTVNRILNGEGVIRPDQAERLANRLEISLKQVLPVEIHNFMALFMRLESLPVAHVDWLKDAHTLVRKYYAEINAPYLESVVSIIADTIATKFDKNRTNTKDIMAAIPSIIVEHLNAYFERDSSKGEA